MADIVDKATRSRMMSGIQGKNTKPEVLVRKGLHAKGFRYSLHSSALPGKPDIVMPKWKTVIFVHGCFWHWHGCALSKLPSSNTTFWSEKLEANRHRDGLVKQQLLQMGWRVITVWECATRGKAAIENLDELFNVLDNWIRNPAESSLELGVPRAKSPNLRHSFKIKK